jgi:hypothetical protein
MGGRPQPTRGTARRCIVRCIGVAVAMVGVLVVIASNTPVQAAQSNTESSPVGVEVSVAPAAGTEQSPVSFKLQRSRLCPFCCD